MIPRSRQVRGLAGVQALLLSPMAEGGHGGRDLREVGRDLALQVVDPTLTPPIDLGCRQPSDAYQHVDRRHVVAIGKGRLGRLDHPLFELGRSRCGHRVRVSIRPRWMSTNPRGAKRTVPAGVRD